MRLWRYLTLASWDRLVEDPRLPVTRLRSFEDGLECFVPMWVEGLRHGWGFGDRARVASDAVDHRRDFASCWFSDEHESIAMWDLYVRRQPGVAVCVLFTDLQELVPADGRLGPVEYVRHDDATAEVPLDRPELWGFYKLWGFRHEREVRLLVPEASSSVDVVGHNWGRLKVSDLLSILSTVRVFAPRRDDSENLASQLRDEVPHADVDLTRAYPQFWSVHEDGEWWAGMRPRPDTPRNP